MARLKELFHVNLERLPIKLHYFLFWCGIGSTTIFVPLLAKNIGITASALGLTYTVSSLTAFFSQPLFGAISDRFHNSKLLVMLLVITNGITLYSLLFIPPISFQSDTPPILLNCTKNNLIIQNHPLYNSTCIKATLNKYCSRFQHANEEQEDNGISFLCNVDNGQKTTPLNESATFDGEIKDSNCKRFLLRGCIEEPQQWIPCDKSLDSCFTAAELNASSLYKTYQLWVFSILTVISQTMMYTCFPLSDAMCYEMLGKNNEHEFGNQRLWSSISYGLASFAAGYFNDMKSMAQASLTYSAGFYIMLGAYFFDLITLYKMPALKVKLKSFSFRNVKQMVKSSEVILIMMVAFIIGIFTAIIWSYQFLYLESIGASQTFLGLTSLFQCFVSDALFFVISGKIIQLIGHFLCFELVFLAFAVRFLAYTVLQNPWYIFPVEILDGVTFSLFYVSLTGFAKVKAPLGIEATMVGLLVASFEGIGVASGNLLGGIGYDYFGARNTFMFACAGSVMCIVIVPIIKCISNMVQRTRNENVM